MAGLALLVAIAGLNLGTGLMRLSAAAFLDHSEGSGVEVTSGTWVQTLSVAQDSWVNEGSAATNYGSDPTMSVQAVLILGQQQSFVQFDLSSIPAGATVRSAELRLCDTGSIGVALDHDLELVDDTWDEDTITANNAPGVIGALPGLTIVLNATLGPTCFFTDVQAHVQAWVDGDVANNGWLISTDVLSALVDYATKEHADASLQPQLVIDYVP